MTPLEIVLGALAIYITILWGIDQCRWKKRESELLDRIMSKHYQEYVLAEDLRLWGHPLKKETKMSLEGEDTIPVT